MYTRSLNFFAHKCFTIYQNLNNIYFQALVRMTLFHYTTQFVLVSKTSVKVVYVKSKRGVKFTKFKINRGYTHILDLNGSFNRAISSLMD